jgi:hypothetical protein
MGTRVKKILNDHWHIDKLKAAKNTDMYGKIKPLDLIVITNGALSMLESLCLPSQLVP